MIGNKYKMTDMHFEVIGEKGDDWIIKIEGEDSPGTISKETLTDSLVMGNAEKTEEK